MATDFEMVAGDTRTLVVPVDDGAGGVVSLDNCTVQWRLARGVNAPTALIEKSTDDPESPAGVTIVPPTGDGLWSFEVRLDPGDTEALKGSFYHEAQIIDEIGEISTVLRGAAKILPALIRPAST